MPDPKAFDFNTFYPFPTGIDTVDDLLTTPADLPEIKPGFAHVPKNGFFGVVFGASCSGKSVLSLELACRFVTAGHMGLKNLSSLQGIPIEKVTKPHFAVLLSQEKPENIAARAKKGFQFVEEHQFTTELKRLDPDGPEMLAVIHMPLDPVLQQAQLIEVFEYVNSRFCCDKGQEGWPDDPKQRILIVLDNAETIRTEAFRELMKSKPGTPVPALPEDGNRAFWKLLREYCNRHRLRVWFTFEENSVPSMQDESSAITTAAETYAADAAIRLGVRVRKGGFLERSLEVLKARDQYFRRGRHHFTIRGHKDGGMGGPSASPDKSKTGIIVFPSMFTQQHRLSREGTPAPTELRQRSKLGLPNIDEEVRLANAHNNDAEDKKKRADGKQAEQKEEKRSLRLTPELPGYLCPKTVSVLVSDLDSVGTDIGLHFVAQPGSKPLRNDPTLEWLYISFHHEPHMLRKIAEKYDSTHHLVKRRQLDDSINYQSKDNRRARCLYFPPEHISESKLLHDINEQIHRIQPNGSPIRVVVDDLMALGERFPLLENRNDFIAALFELFRRCNVIALVLDSVEVGEGRNPVEQSLPAAMADHVFLLRHIELQNRTRKIFSVYKLAEFSEPKQVWELERHGADRELKADATRIQFFKGLVSGRPKPVQITLSLYADSVGSPQHRHLQRQQEILSKTFGQKIDIHACHPEDYSVLQHTVGQSVLPVVGDCHIIAVDEIWLEQLVTARLVAGFQHEAPSQWEKPFEKLAESLKKDNQQPKEEQLKQQVAEATAEFVQHLDTTTTERPKFHWDGAHYVTSAHDLAVECATMTQQAARQSPPADLTRRHYAIPDRHNAGLLTFYRRMRHWTDCKTFAAAAVRQPDPSVAAAIARAFVDDPPQPTWEELETLQTAFVQWRFARKEKAKDREPPDPPDYRDLEMADDKRLEMLKLKREMPNSEFAWGAFTFSMENRECCVSFLLELVLSFLKNSEHLVNKDRKLDFSAPFKTAWVKALRRLLTLLDPWDIHRLADCWYRPANSERPCLYSRQWFTGWGELGQTRPGLEVLPLPLGSEMQPISVSGTWYLAMLAGSTALNAGKAIVQRLTDPDNALHRFNHGIALPVELKWYAKSASLSLIPHLPYAQQMCRQTAALDLVRTRREVQRQLLMKGAKRQNAGQDRPILEALRQSKCPFHRTTIQNYSSEVSPALMGLIVGAARKVIPSDWLLNRNPTAFPQTKIEELVDRIALELA